MTSPDPGSVQLTTVAYDVVFWLVTGILAVAVTVIGWFFSDMIKSLKAAIKKQEEVSTQSYKFFDSKLEAEKEKSAKALKDVSEVLWDKITKVEENHTDKYDKLNDTITTMKDALVESINNLKLELAKKHP